MTSSAEPHIQAADFLRGLLTKVLDDLFDQARGTSEIVSQSLQNISLMYKGRLSLASSHFRSDWDNPANRCAYVFLYLMQHCYLVYFSLQKNLDGFLVGWHQTKDIKVCSIGGGPGSDLVGLTTFLRENKIFLSSLECLVLDLYPKWKDTWDTIYSCIPEDFKVTYRRCDLVRDSGVPSDVSKFIQEADMLTFVKSFSAVSAFFRTDSRKGDFLRDILRKIKPGCFVMYIDNYHGGDTQFQREFASPVGLELVFSFHGTPTLPFGQYSNTIRNYCRNLDYSPMRSCDVIIQFYKNITVHQPVLVGQVDQASSCHADNSSFLHDDSTETKKKKRKQIKSPIQEWVDLLRGRRNTESVSLSDYLPVSVPE